MFQPLGGSSRDPLFSRFALLKVPLPAPDRLGEVEHAKPGYTALARAYFPLCNLSLASFPSKIHVLHCALYLSGNKKKESHCKVKSSKSLNSVSKIARLRTSDVDPGLADTSCATKEKRKRPVRPPFEYGPHLSSS